MPDEKGKKGQVSAQSQTYTEEQIGRMSDADVLAVASANGIEVGTRQEAVEQLRQSGIIIHGQN